MNKQIEALKIAIYSFEKLMVFDNLIAEIQICKEALAEADKQEPVAWVSEVTLENIEWVRKQDTDNCLEIFCCCDKWDDNNVPLYTHPATWQSLSDDEKKSIQNNSWIINSDGSKEFNTFVFARAIEQALKEKNHA